MKIRSVSHIGLTVSDFEKSVRWYSEIFGFMLISEQILNTKQVNDLYKLYGLKDNALRLGFLRGPRGDIIEIFEFLSALPSQQTVWNRPGPTHITFDVKNIDKWYEHLSKKGIDFLCKPQNTDGNEWVFLRDPDGNLIELIDLKFNYHIIRWLGGIAGWFMKRGKYKAYYTEANNAQS